MCVPAQPKTNALSVSSSKPTAMRATSYPQRNTEINARSCTMCALGLDKPIARSSTLRDLATMTGTGTGRTKLCLTCPLRSMPALLCEISKPRVLSIRNTNATN